MKKLTRRNAMVGLAMGIEFNAGTIRKPLMQEAVLLAADVDTLRKLFRRLSRKKFNAALAVPALLTGDITIEKKKT